MSVLLVVEDEALIRWALVDDLIDAGFEVVEAASGTEALSALHGPQSFTLLLTDVDLGPGPSGLDIARMARELRPELPVMVISGRPPPAMGDGSWQTWTTKPVHTAELVATACRLAKG